MNLYGTCTKLQVPFFVFGRKGDMQVFVYEIRSLKVFSDGKTRRSLLLVGAFKSYVAASSFIKNRKSDVDRYLIIEGRKTAAAVQSCKP